MIFAFTGKTGSGKTFLMIKMAYKYWKQGVDIYSNTVLLFAPDLDTSVRLNIVDHPSAFAWWEHVKWFFHYTAKPTAQPYERGRIIYFEHIDEIMHISNGLILFDEAQVLFNARAWESLSRRFQYKLQQHRKHQLDLICTTQNMGTIDITYRRLVQKWTHCENLFQFGKSPKIALGIFRACEKDIDELFNKVDDLMVGTIQTKLFFIHRFSPRLYDTMYDIGFKWFKTVWLSLSNPEQEKKTTAMFWIIPKEMSLKDAQKQLSLSTSLLDQPKSRTWKRNSKN